MIVFGVCMATPERFQRIAKPSIEKWHGSDSHVLTRVGQTSICRAYNSMLDEVCDLAGLEGVVFIHDDVELCAPIDGILREAFSNPDVAVMGAIGGSGSVRAMPWWSRPERHGAVRTPGSPPSDRRGWHDVDVLDGVFIAVSPWSARHLRFDADAFPGFHGYDADICSAAQAVGKRVLVGPLDVMHHHIGYHSRASYLSWLRANLTWQLKWDSPSAARSLRLRLRRSLLPMEARLRPRTRRRLAEFKD